MTKHSRCSCDLDATYLDCCGRYHNGEMPPTPQALMRARYSAYARGLEHFVLQTWHASTRPATIHDEGPTAQWVRLEVKQFETRGESGMVEFVAVSKRNGRAHRMHERSRFVREDDKWFYLDGEVR